MPSAFVSQSAETASRIILIGTVAISPWLIGSVPAQFQLWIAYAILVSFLLWIVSRVTRDRFDEVDGKLLVPPAVALLGLLMVAGIAQLATSAPQPIFSSPWSLELEELRASAKEEAPAFSRSMAPAMTRFQLARLMIVVVAAFLGAQLFRTPGDMRLLFGALAATGAALAIFGIGQKLTWNGLLFGSIPLRYGGEPYGPFINRNNAAGFLNICLSAGLGGIVLAADQRLRGNPRSTTIIFAVLSIFISAGVVATISRGGILSTFVGVCAIAPLLLRSHGWKSLAGILVGGVCVFSLGTWLHFNTAAANRMDTLNDGSFALGGRWEHWSDTSRAFADRPWLGSGWGTYRYANLPYQDREWHNWFWNADNQFFEIAVEGGLLTVLIVLLFIAVFAVALLRLAVIEDSSFDRSLIVSGVFLVVSLGLQSGTDFGISLLALSIASSVLVGAISARTLILQTEMATNYSQSQSSILRWGGVATMMLLAIGAGWAGLEMRRVQPGMTFTDKIPLNLDAPDLMTSVQLDELISEGEKLVARVPDDAELRLCLARLLICRCQQGIVEATSVDGALEARQAVWNQCRLEGLSEISRLKIDPDSVARVQSLPEIQNNLPRAVRELLAAEKACPILPGVGYRLALLSTLDLPVETPGLATALRNEARLSADDSSKLLTLGRIALHYHEDDLAILCFRRGLTLNPLMFKDVIKEVRAAFEDDHIARRVFSSPEQLVSFSLLTSDVSARQMIATRLAEFAETLRAAAQADSEGRQNWISAHVALLTDREADAIQFLQKSIDCEPFRVDWRLELSELLIRQGDDARAREQLSFAVRLDPENEQIRKRLAEVVSRELKRRPAEGGATPSRGTGASSLPPWSA